MTYAELAEQIDAVRAGLAMLGVKRGDRVAVISRNRVEWAIGCYATVGLGAAYVPMYEEQAEHDWRHILIDSGAAVCFVAGGVRDRATAIAGQVPTLRHVVAFDAPAEDTNGWRALLEKGRQNPVPCADVEPTDIAEIVYTSGTTGTPKGALLTHHNIVSDIDAVRSVIPFDTDDRTLSFLPWAHVFGGSELHGVVSIGCSAAICSAVDHLAAEMGEVRPTLLFAVPRIWNRVYQSVGHSLADKPRVIRSLVERALVAKRKQRRGEPLTISDRSAASIANALVFSKIRQKFGGRLRIAVSAAAALAPEVAELIDALGIIVLEAYGLTETSGAATINRVDGRRIGSVGKALPGVRIEIDSSVSPGDGGNGEIVVFGHCVMAGYHHLPDESRKSLTDAGGLRTGDLGRFDAQGFLYVTGRLKELYKLENGKYVAPAAIEEKLTLSPYIEQAFVHGANRPHNVAIIVPSREGLTAWAKEQGIEEPSYESLVASEQVRTLLESEVQRGADELRGYERIGAHLIVTEPFSTTNELLTPTLKVKRRAVEQRYHSQLELLYRTGSSAAMVPKGDATGKAGATRSR